jgi:hypothetical protein
VLLRSFNLTTMAGIYAATLKSAEADHWGYRKFLLHLNVMVVVHPELSCYLLLFERQLQELLNVELLLLSHSLRLSHF